MSDSARCYSFAPTLRLGVRGAAVILRHFEAEYGPAAAPDNDDVQVRIDFGEDLQRCGPGLVAGGGHKTVRWRVKLAAPDRDPLAACIRLSGRPRSFGLSLVQGYFVEPLLSIAAARSDLVLLPSAAIAEADGALLIVGRSRTGKSSLSVRAAAAGRAVLGDDQVLVDRAGACRSFPRRLRFYSDLRETASAAHRQLPASARRALAFRLVLRTVTRGYVAPPVRVPVSIFGGSQPREALPLRRIAVLRRAAAVPDLETKELGIEEGVAEAVDILAEQRAVFAGVGGPDWAGALAEAARQERTVLAAAFSGRPIQEISIPREWEAPRAITAIADLLGTERSTAESSG
jgi:hypothetical protein